MLRRHVARPRALLSPNFPELVDPDKKIATDHSDVPLVMHTRTPGNRRKGHVTVQTKKVDFGPEGRVPSRQEMVKMRK